MATTAYSACSPEEPTSFASLGRDELLTIAEHLAGAREVSALLACTAGCVRHLVGQTALTCLVANCLVREAQAGTGDEVQDGAILRAATAAASKHDAAAPVVAAILNMAAGHSDEHAITQATLLSAIRSHHHVVATHVSRTCRASVLRRCNVRLLLTEAVNHGVAGPLPVLLPAVRDAFAAAASSGPSVADDNGSPSASTSASAVSSSPCPGACGSGSYEDFVSQALLEAARRGSADIAACLIAAGADVQYAHGAALEAAAYRGHMDVVALLLEGGASVHARQSVALRRACWFGRADVARLLIKAGADFRAANEDCLYGAAHNGHAAVVRMLLAAGADVSAFDGRALRVAAQHGHREVAQLLLEAAVQQLNGASLWRRLWRQAQIRRMFSKAVAARDSLQRPSVLPSPLLQQLELLHDAPHAFRQEHGEHHLRGLGGKAAAVLPAAPHAAADSRRDVLVGAVSS